MSRRSNGSRSIDVADRMARDLQVYTGMVNDSMNDVVGLDGCAVLDVDAARVAATAERLLGMTRRNVRRTCSGSWVIRTECGCCRHCWRPGSCACVTWPQPWRAPSRRCRIRCACCRAAGVVRHRRAGRKVFYALDDTHVRLLLDVSIEHVRHQGA